jgi:iron-binding CDGSH zinc finger protein
MSFWRTWDGPYIITGGLKLILGDNNNINLERERQKNIILCRCGASKTSYSVMVRDKVVNFNDEKS